MKSFFSFCGKVIKGNKKARKVQFPTANVMAPSEIPAGVYAVRVGVGNKIYQGVGYKRKKESIFEVYIFGFKGDLYRKEIKLELFEKIREPMEFKNQKEIQEQIEKDCKKAKEVLE